MGDLSLFSFQGGEAREWVARPAFSALRAAASTDVKASEGNPR